jgi:hypothetical protein
MEKLTRRKLITQASVGTGAAGVLAITAACASSSNLTSSNNTTSSNDIAASSSATSANTIDEPLAVFVTDAAKGTLKIMRGDQEIIINNPSLASGLLALV